MKKIFLILSILLLTNCSDRGSTSSDNEYCNIIIDGQTTHHESPAGFSFSYGATNCTTHYPQRIQNVGQFENASYFIDLYFVHNENLINFQGYNITNSAVKNKSLDIINPLCYNNLDFIAEYRDKSNNTILNFNSTSSNTNTIKSITLYKEDSLEKTYVVEGNFSLTYKKADNTLIPLKGDYKTFIYILK